MTHGGLSLCGKGSDLEGVVLYTIRVGEAELNWLGEGVTLCCCCLLLATVVRAARVRVFELNRLRLRPAFDEVDDRRRWTWLRRCGKSGWFAVELQEWQLDG